MIINEERLAVVALTLSLIAMFVSSTVFSQDDRERREFVFSEDQVGPTTHLTGEWILNKDLSDDPAKVMESMRKEHRGGGFGRQMHGGGGGEGPDPGRMEALQRAMEAPAKLIITQEEGSITLIDGDGHSQTLAINNKKERHQSENGIVEVKTKWDDGRLVKETYFDDGLKLTETYSLLPDANQMRVLANLKGSHIPRELTLKRVYDREGYR